MIETEAQRDSLAERLQVHIDRASVLSDKIKALEGFLKDAATEYTRLIELDIPGLLQEYGLSSATTASGVKVTVADDVYARISEANLNDAVAWLRQSGNGGIVKHKLDIRIDEDQQEYAQKLAKKLQNDGVLVTESLSIHPQTLQAFIREGLERGLDIPNDLFGVFVKRTAKIA